MASVNEPVDQVTATQSMVINGVHCFVAPAVLKASAGSTNVYKFTKTFSFYWQGAHLTYKQNSVYALDSALKVALLAASAPMTQQ